MDPNRASCCFIPFSIWKIIGYVIGWLGIALNIILAVGFATDLRTTEDKWFIVALLLIFVKRVNGFLCVLLALNSMASIIWLIGLMKEKDTFMLVPLYWWVVPFGVCMRAHLWLYLIAFCAVYYSLAVMTYLAMRRELKRSSQIPVTPGSKKDMRAVTEIDQLP